MQVIEESDFVILDKPRGQRCTDKTGPAGNQNMRSTNPIVIAHYPSPFGLMASSISSCVKRLTSGLAANPCALLVSDCFLTNRRDPGRKILARPSYRISLHS